MPAISYTLDPYLPKKKLFSDAFRAILPQNVVTREKDSASVLVYSHDLIYDFSFVYMQTTLNSLLEKCPPT